MSVFVLVLAAASCSGERSAAESAATEYAAAPEPRSAGRTATSLRFTDITREAGIDFVHENGASGRKWMPETVGSGGGFLDYDVDGRPDLFLVNGTSWPGERGEANRSTSRLYRNLGSGRFEDMTRQAGLDLDIYGMGMAAADYDADGDPDLYVTAVGTNRLLRNDGGAFVDVTAELGVTGNSPEPGAPPGWSTGAAWLDADGDGWLDLFVCNYVRWTPETDLFQTLDGTRKAYATPEAYPGDSCRMYRNIRGRTFRDVTRLSGLENPDGKSLGVAVTDIDGDGRPDIVVANDTEPNFLYHNLGRGRFEDIALRAGVAFDEYGRARAGMGVSVGDVRGDGLLAIAIGNFSREPVALFEQITADLFQDQAGPAGIAPPTLLPLTFGVLFEDLDLDGRLDLLLANGHIEPEINDVQKEIRFEQSPQLFLGDGRGDFEEVGRVVGPDFGRPLVGRGLAAADIDGDGDLDVLITANGGRPRLLRNDLPSGTAHWIRLHLKGRAPNRDAIGASVTLYAGVAAQRRRVETGGSYLSQSDLATLVLGLGERESADSLLIRWAGGSVTRALALEADADYEFSEPEANDEAGGFITEGRSES
ncbi:MAG: CRTAC1 family protein [Gemmatimonadota bacterium]